MTGTELAMVGGVLTAIIGLFKGKEFLEFLKYLVNLVFTDKKKLIEQGMVDKKRIKALEATVNRYKKLLK